MPICHPNAVHATNQSRGGMGSRYILRSINQIHINNLCY